MSTSPNLVETDEVRVFHRHITGSEIEISHWIDENLEIIKNHYCVDNNNQVAVLIRNDRSGQIYNEELRTPHKYLKTTALESDSSPWSMIFRDILYFIFLANETKSNIVLNHVGDLSSEKLKKISIILDGLKLLRDTPANLSRHLDKFFEVALLILPDEENLVSVSFLKAVLSDSDLLASFIPPAANEVQILTLHKSKGLEFNIVLHVDLYEWVLPGRDAVNGDRDALIQDLNLHYVGITRAIDACVLLTSTQRRFASGSTGRADISRFLDYHNLRNLRNSR